MKKWIVHFLFLVISVYAGRVYSQQNVRKESTQRVSYKSEAFILLDSASYYSESDPEEAIAFIEQSMRESIDLKDRSGEAYGYKLLGSINYNLSQFEVSIDNYKKAIEIFSSLRAEEGLYDCYKSIGMAYESLGQYDLALKNYGLYLNQAEKKKRPSDISLIKNRIASVYNAQGKFSKALTTYQEVLNIEEQRGNKQGMIEANDNMGKSSLESDNPDDAIHYFNKSRDIAQDINDPMLMNSSLNNISDVYRSTKKYDQELELRQQSLSMNTENVNIPAQTKDNYEIGNLFLEQDNSEEAIQYLEKSLELSDEVGDLQQKSQVLQSLSTAYDKTGNPKEALDKYKEYIATVDSMYKQKERTLIKNLALNTELTKKLNRIDMLEKDKQIRERKIEVLEKEQNLRDQGIRTQQIIIYSLLGGMIVLIISSLIVYRSSRQKRKANQLLALKSLRSQMNPHFIFNALNSVNSFISKSDEKAANKYLSDFSRLMRMVLENSKYDFAGLASEVAILELYLNLEHFRFSEKFDYSFTVDPSISLESVEIPPMMIQPYIENAIWHGLRYKDTKGFLNVNINKEQNLLKVVIEDNGIGRKKSKEFKTRNQKESSSTGMKNTENRIKIINELHKTRLNVNIKDLNSDGTGTRVELVIFAQETES